MDRSTLRLPDPDAQLRKGERRRTVRQKLHTPVYVSFNTQHSGAVVDLSELLDLHENGFAVQTALPTALQNTDRLEVNRAVSLCLDLPETRQFVHGSGQVMWTDDTGRAGIRFSFLPDSSRLVLKEWLFANLLVASTNHSARASQLALQREESHAGGLHAVEPFTSHTSTAEPFTAQASTGDDSTSELLALDPASELAPVENPLENSLDHPTPGNEPDAADSERAHLLSELDDVRRQIKSREIVGIDGGLRASFDAALQLITERAACLTGASGAALALLTGDKFICRASIGQPAPPVGSEVDARSGLSGECLRTGTLVSCGNTESDPRVDPEICRMFGIGSFMAAPIFVEFRVVGLVEVFSPYPYTFSQHHEIVLERLAELVPSDEGEPINQKKIEARIDARDVENSYSAVVRLAMSATEQTAEPETKAIQSEASENKPIESAALETQPTESEPIEPQPTATEPIETAPEKIRQSAHERNAILKEILQQSSRGASDRTTVPVPERPPDQPSERASQQASEQPLPRPSPQPSQKPSGEAAFDEVVEESLSSARRFPLSHLVLLVLTIAVAAMALGYLLAPTIEQHWLRSPQAARASSNSAAQQSSADTRRRLSPAEVGKLAEQGEPDAEWQLGILYHDGDGVPKDDALAVQWFERAAEQGYVPAQSTLGAYYWAGRGVPQDFSKAYFWSQLALAQGDENSKSRLEGLSAEMTQTQVAAARQQAEAWLHAHNQTANSKAN
jgi:hypothetical protein